MKMNKRIRIALVTTLLLVVMALFASMSSTTAKGPNGLQPKLTVQLSRRAMELDSDEFMDTWLYVRNPSRDMETTYPVFPREIVHVVEVIDLDVVITLPDGTLETYNLAPDYTPYRWDTTVYPGETSLVYFVGWQFPSGDGYETGVYRFTYTLNVDFEGEGFNLVRAFSLRVQ